MDVALGGVVVTDHASTRQSGANTVMVRGIVYDTGCETTSGRVSRVVFDEQQVAVEMRVIARDLHCTAVRIVGNDAHRLALAARLAGAEGLALWLSPVAHDRPASDLLALVEQVAGLCGELERAGHDVVLVVGWETSAFVRGMISGRTTFDRLRTLASIPRLLVSTARHGSFNKRLNEHLADAVAVARQDFKGPLTYAAGMWEDVDWSRFDIVGVDAYRDSGNAESFVRLMAAFANHGKPFAALEFGCCTYRGAAARGALGWTVADPVARQVTADVVRDEMEQADYLESVYRQLEHAGSSATFPFTFASYSYPTLRNGVDLDVGAYGIVRTFEEPNPNSAYPEMPWEPKLAFHRLAALYAEAVR